MKTSLYYTVERHTEQIGIVEIINGDKTIYLYDSNCELIAEIESSNDKNSEKEIQTWLDKNNMSAEYEFIQL